MTGFGCVVILTRDVEFDNDSVGGFGYVCYRIEGLISIFLLLRMGCMDGEEVGARGWRVMYRLFRPGRWSRGLHVPRSAPLDPYFHFLVEGRSPIGLME